MSKICNCHEIGFSIRWSDHWKNLMQKLANVFWKEILKIGFRCGSNGSLRMRQCKYWCSNSTIIIRIHIQPVYHYKDDQNVKLSFSHFLPPLLRKIAPIYLALICICGTWISKSFMFSVIYKNRLYLPISPNPTISSISFILACRLLKDYLRPFPTFATHDWIKDICAKQWASMMFWIWNCVS